MGGMWVVVDRNAVADNPMLSPYASTLVSAPAGAPPRPPRLNGAAVFPSFNVAGPPPTLRLLEADPNLFFNAPFISTRFVSSLNSRATNVADHQAALVTLRAGTAGLTGIGNIQGLRLNFGSVPFKKKMTVEAAQDIREFSATLAAPLGVESVVSAGGTISMRPGGAQGEQPGALNFVGAGTARVKVTGDLDLGTSDGINFRFLPSPTGDGNKGGFLDVAVGGNIIMDRSRIGSFNGATISVHGLGTNPIVDSAGNPLVRNGDPVAVVGTGIVGSDGLTRINVTVRDAQGQTQTKEVKYEGKTILLNGSEERLTGPVTVHVSLVEQNGQLVLRNGERVELLRSEGRPVLLNGDLVLVRRDGTAILAQASDVSIVTPSGGSITVGTQASGVLGAGGVPLGILALRGGAIDLFATGTVDVAKSRIATFGSVDASGQPYRAGDINVTSVTGNINAGSGGADEVTVFTFKEQGSGEDFRAEVPGSGIFSFHSGDQPRGEKLVFPRFDDAQINAIRLQIKKLETFGRDTSKLRALEKQLLAEREPIFTQEFENFIADKRLGNITLFAEQRNIVVPSAGIRGRRITLLAPNGTLDLQGGVIAGLTSFTAGSVVGSVSSSFSGTVAGATSSGSVTGASSAGGGTLGGLTGATGSVSAASSSATAAATGTAAKSTATVQEAAEETAAEGAEAAARRTASKSDDKDKKKTSIAQSIKMKHGVIIQVEVKPQPGS
jgi:hypothetical protein